MMIKGVFMWLLTVYNNSSCTAAGLVDILPKASTFIFHGIDNF